MTEGKRRISSFFFKVQALSFRYGGKEISDWGAVQMRNQLVRPCQIP
jgi:hypothetical protein